MFAGFGKWYRIWNATHWSCSLLYFHCQTVIVHLFQSEPIGVCELWRRISLMCVCVCVCTCVFVCDIIPFALIEARWCVETVNVFPWISVVGWVLIDSDLTALHALSYSETIEFTPPLASPQKPPPCFFVCWFTWALVESQTASDLQTLLRIASSSCCFIMAFLHSHTPLSCQGFTTTC